MTCRCQTRPPLYWYDDTLAIHIMAHHHETVPRFKCSGCKMRYVNQHNRLRCESSHPIVHGKMQSTSSQYGAMQVTKWWDGLSYEERYAVVGAESIRYGMEAPIYHTIEDTKGRLLLDLLQEQMEGTALCRQINAVPQIPMDVKSAGPYRVCNRLLELYVSWCSRTLLADEHNQVIKTATKAKQRRLKALMKKAPVSDHAFRQLTEFADSLSWTTMQDEEPVLDPVVQPVAGPRECYTICRLSEPMARSRLRPAWMDWATVSSVASCCVMMDCFSSRRSWSFAL
jgi:hypothetical protein